VTFRVLGISAVAAYRFLASSMPLPPRGTGLRGVSAMTPGQESKLSDPSSRGLLLSSELDRRRPPEHANTAWHLSWGSFPFGTCEDRSS
jgi:hypothetical protein